MKKNLGQNKKDLTNRIKAYMTKKGLNKSLLSVKELDEIAIECNCSGFDVMMVCRFGKVL